jgi:hypothetical protein
MTLYIIQILIAVTILLVVALLVYFSLRLLGSSASLRHAALLTGLGGTLVLPAVTPFVSYRLVVNKPVKPEQAATVAPSQVPLIDLFFPPYEMVARGELTSEPISIKPVAEENTTMIEEIFVRKYP